MIKIVISTFPSSLTGHTHNQRQGFVKPETGFEVIPRNPAFVARVDLLTETRDVE